MNNFLSKFFPKRAFLVLGLILCFLLTGCEFFTPDTSSALSQTKQLEELQNQTKQLQRQADAMEHLVDMLDSTLDRNMP